MIYSLTIKDNTKTPYYYIKDLFENGKEFRFDKGVNIIIGPNGSGKSTILKLLQDYNLTTKSTESNRLYSNRLFDYQREYEGIDIFADYRLKTFNLECTSEMNESQFMRDFISFSKAFEKYNSSMGEAQISAIGKFFDTVFSTKDYKFPDISDLNSELDTYFKDHTIKTESPIITMLMDEPDRNLDLNNIKQLLDIFSHKRDDTQIIATIHNPLLIYKLKDKVNIIDLTGNYLNEIINFIKS